MNTTTVDTSAWVAVREAHTRFLAHTEQCMACPQPGPNCGTRQALWREYEKLHAKALRA